MQQYYFYKKTLITNETVVISECFNNEPKDVDPNEDCDRK